jgi:hypothetical protein
MFLKIRFFAVAFLFAQVGFGSFARAQSLPATPHTPDLLGIYPGMPMNAARAQLQKRSSTINVMTNSQPDTGFGLTIPDPANHESTLVYLTMAPNDPMVWMITRSQNFTLSPANVMSQNSLLTALREKYGKETFTRDQGGGGLYIYWLFDPGGKLLTSADQTLQGCNGGQMTIYMANGLPQAPTQVEQACFKSYFGLKASLNLGNNGLVNSYVVELANFPYAYAAGMNTANVKKAAEQKAQQDLIKRSNQNKPSF